MHAWGKKSKRIPDEWREAYMRHRSPEEMRRDLVEAFDRIGQLQTRLWVLGGVVVGEGAVIGWLATSLLSCIELSHKAVALLR